MARTKPLLDIDAAQVEKLARYGCSNVTIADFFGCSEATIRGRFCEAVAKGRANRRITLHQRQFEAADNGNIAMLIWLGKQDLGQSDKVEQRTEITTIVHGQKQRSMLGSERAFDLACDLEEEITTTQSAYDAATRDDPGGIRPPGQ